MEIIYFSSSPEFRQWLEENHSGVLEQWVGFYKKGSGKKGISYGEAVDQALCYGWIDGLRKSVDGERYTIRFTPRKARSIWSSVNLKRVKELEEMGLMAGPGRKALNGRDTTLTKLYSYEEKERPLETAYEKIFKENSKAWEYFQAQPSSYKKAAQWWVMGAKKEETRLKRLENLIQKSSQGLRLPHLVSPGIIK